MSERPESGYAAGFACLIGRPNAGKSTLTNALVGQKVAITSSKPQTTRHTIRGIVSTPGSQLVLVDTPGLRAAIDDGAMVPERVEEFRKHYDSGAPGSPEMVAQALWAALPPDENGPDVIEVGVIETSARSPGA